MPDLPNAMVNAVLCYISSVRQSYTEHAIISTHKSFFNGEKISKAKEILFQCSNEAITRRRGEGKIDPELNDLICFFRKLDEEQKPPPMFVVDRHDSIPPASGFEVIAEHIVGLMEEISNLKSEILSFKKARDVPTCPEITEIKEELSDIKIWIKSACNLPAAKAPFAPTKAGSTSYAESLRGCNGAATKQQAKPSSTALLAVLKQPRPTEQSPSDRSQEVRVGKEACDFSKTSEVAENGRGTGNANRNEQGPDIGWQLVQRKNKRDVIKGNKKSGNVFKGITRSVDLYIGRCDPSVSVEAIRQYILNESNIEVSNCICLASDEAVAKSFKVTVSPDERDKLMNVALWPENIVVRKYYNSRNNGSRK